MKEELLLIKNELLEEVYNSDLKEAISKRFLLAKNDDELIKHMKSLALDLILENNAEFLEEVAKYEEYEVINKKYLLIMKKIYDYEVANDLD